MILRVKEFFKKRLLLFPILPVLLIELVVLNKSLKNFFWQNFQVGQAVLGAKTDFLPNLAIEKILIGVVIFLVILIGILIFKGSEKTNKD